MNPVSWSWLVSPELIVFVAISLGVLVALAVDTYRASR